MKLTTKGRYGIKAMLALAAEYESGEKLSASQLAEMQHISSAYLEQLIASLKKAGLVNSSRGVQGGYSLSRPPEEISLGEVLTALEGNMDLVDCVGCDTDKSECDSIGSCSARPIWLELQKRIDDFLDSTSLKDAAEHDITNIENERNTKAE